jgi:hypothetical protein
MASPSFGVCAQIIEEDPRLPFSSEPNPRAGIPRSDPKLSTLNKWYRALDGAGVEFIDESVEDDRGSGVRLRHGGKPAGKRK